MCVCDVVMTTNGGAQVAAAVNGTGRALEGRALILSELWLPGNGSSAVAVAVTPTLTSDLTATFQSLTNQFPRGLADH